MFLVGICFVNFFVVLFVVVVIFLHRGPLHHFSAKQKKKESKNSIDFTGSVCIYCVSTRIMQTND